MRRFLRRGPRATALALTVASVAAVLSGCGSLSNAVGADPGLLATLQAPASVGEPSGPALSGAPIDQVDTPGDAPAAPPLGAVEGRDDDRNGLAIVQAQPEEKIDSENAIDGDETYDPWEPFNERVFEFNYRVDRYVLKPVAKAYNVVMPEPFQVLIANGFDNISFVPRMVNSLLQGKWSGAGREVSRFLINSTAGIGGLFDAAKYWGIEKSREDFGQTLGVWGVGPGPYLIVPFMEPLTVRDGIGKAVDGFMDPLSYVLPLLWTRVGMKIGEVVNDRSLNLDLFQGFEESIIDMYSAVRHGYLRRRERLIKE